MSVRFGRASPAQGHAPGNPLSIHPHPTQFHWPVHRSKYGGLRQTILHQSVHSAVHSLIANIDKLPSSLEHFEHR